MKSLILFAACILATALAKQRHSVVTNEVEKQLKGGHPTKYRPTWTSLDSRPLPSWYDEAKVGIFLHWGVYSVPSFGSEWFWKYWKAFKTPEYVDFMKRNYKPDFTYQDFAPDFTAELFNATAWAELFEKSGAKYVVLTSKHHEGYTMWPSTYSFSWNSMDVGPHRDIVGELATAVRQGTDLKFGLYYSLFEWFNRMWMTDKESFFVKETFATNKVWPELTELINLYQPDLLWSDGDAEAPDTYWRSRQFLAWLYNDSPVKDTVVTNDRWGYGVMCKHGGFLTCADRYNPGTLQTRKWENAMTLDKNSWGHRDNVDFDEYITTDELITEIVTTVSCGGNILVNVGPSKSGIIEPIFVERLLDMGQWLAVNGEAIYKSKPWTHQNDTGTPNIWYTTATVSGQQIVYAMLLERPADGNLVALYALAGAVRADSSVQLLGYDGDVQWETRETSLQVELPDEQLIKHLKWAWTIKVTL